MRMVACSFAENLSSPQQAFCDAQLGFDGELQLPSRGRSGNYYRAQIEMQVCSLLHLSRVIRQRGAGSNRIKPWYLRVKVTAPFTV